MTKNKHVTNDGTTVYTKKALASWGGAFKNGHVSERLYLNDDGQYYLLSYEDDSCEWMCPDLAIAWFEKNGIWNLPNDLNEYGKQGKSTVGA